MSSLKRMLAVLDVFSLETQTLTAEEVMSRLGYSRGTAYRYIRELTTSGFLSRIGGKLSLGPRIIELDYYIRQSDPNLQVIQPVMRSVSDRLDCDVLLTSFFEDRVVVRHHERGTDQLTMSFGRGRRMPLFRGAGSKAIIAALPSARQKRLFADYAEEIKESGLGSTWKEFRANLAAMRRAGYVISMGELDRGNVGVAAPIFLDPAPNPPGSLVLVFSARRFAIVDEALLAQICVDAAAQINALIQNLSGVGANIHLIPNKRPA